MWSRYECLSCGKQYVVQHDIIRCPYCQSKEREQIDVLYREDWNRILNHYKEVRELLQECLQDYNDDWMHERITKAMKEPEKEESSGE